MEEENNKFQVEVFSDGFGYLYVPICPFCNEIHKHGHGTSELKQGYCGERVAHCPTGKMNEDYILIWKGKTWPYRSAKAQKNIIREMKEKGITSRI